MLLQAKAAIPLLIIAPLLGFGARCIVDYIHAQIEDQVGRRFAEMESWQARHRPRVKRWQHILDEDRDEYDTEPLQPSASYEYQVSCICSAAYYGSWVHL